MKKYLFIILLVGVWSCEEEPKDCAGVSGGDNICGCADSLATNFDATATFDDESCEYDTTPPNVTLTFISDGTVSEIVSITVMVNDDSGIEKVELWVDGTNTNITDDTEPYELKWNTSALENNSSHIIIVRVYDVWGNITDSEPRTLVIDNSSAVPANVDVSYSYSSNSFNITWTKNNDTDFSSYTLYESEVNDQSIGTQIYQTDDQNDTTYTVSGVQTGTVYYFWITVKDTVGLMNTSSSISAVSYLFRAEFAHDWLCADCGEGIIMLSDPEGNFITMETWVGNASLEILPPDGLTSIPDKISVTTITSDDIYNSSTSLNTNMNIPVGSSWTWGKEYPDEPDWDNPPEDVEFNFSNVPEHSGFIMSGAWRNSSGGTILDWDWYSYNFTNWEPYNYYIKLNTLYNGVRYTFLENVAPGEITVDLSNLDLTDSTSINLNGNSIGYRTYLYGYQNPGNRYAGRYCLDRAFGFDSLYNSVNVYHPPNMFTDYRTSLYFFEDESNDFWYQSVYGNIPTDFIKIEDFEYVSTSPTNFEISTTSTNFDQIRSSFSYYDGIYSGWWNIYGPSDLSAYVLPLIPDEVREIFPLLETELFSVHSTDLIDYPELNSYYEILELVFESPNLFYDVVNEYRARVKYYQEQNLRHIQNDDPNRIRHNEDELYPGDQMYHHDKQMRDRTIK